MTMTVRESGAAAPVEPPALMPIPAEPMTWEQWLAFEPVEGSGRYELVEGVPVVSPSESFLNVRAAMRVARLLLEFEDEYECFPNAGIRTAGEPAATGRQPDLLVMRKGSVPDSSYVAGDEVVLAVECVSAGSSDERDWVTKRAEYARAGVRAYLVIDRGRGQIVLFDRIVDGRYSRRTDGDPEVTLELGEHRIPVRLDQLVD